MFVDIHILQNFAPSNLNRDDTGAPKDCVFGGYRRARISSQCLKRAVRTHFAESKLFEPQLLATRTKRVIDAVAARLPKRAGEDVAVAVAALLAGAKIGIKEGKTEYLLYLGDGEIQRIAELCDKNWTALTSATSKGSGEAEGKKKTAKEVKREAKDSLSPELQKEVVSLLGSGKAVDLALFGRMLADMPEKNIDAACQVAHALSTNEVAMEMDFYTAVDDLRPGDTQGADMMGMVEFNSSCFYRYAKLDLDQLRENLRGDVQLTTDAAIALVRAAVAAVPTGKQNSMAAHNPPFYVRVLVRKGGEAWNLANAFLKPVRPGKVSDGDIAQASVGALDAHLAALRRMYGSDGIVADLTASLFDTSSLTVPDLLGQLGKNLS
jgi:CRISPR system Cascade subunit CasC